MGASVSPAAVQEVPPSKSFGARFVGVFISPGSTFADIARRPDFIAPLVVSVLLSVVGTEIFLAKIGLEPIVRYAFEHSSGASNMSPEQIQQMLGRIVPIQTIMAHVMGLLWVPLLCVIVAAMGLMIVNSIFSGQIRFKTALSVPSYAYLVKVIYLLMSTVLVVFGDPEHIISNPQNPTPSNLGFFLNPLETSKPLLVLAGSLDIFTIWFTFLLGIGFSEATGRKVKAVTMFLCFVGIWAILVLVQMGFSLLR